MFDISAYDLGKPILFPLGHFEGHLMRDKGDLKLKEKKEEAKKKKPKIEKKRLTILQFLFNSSKLSNI
jgi:hypothetical protein